jgi:predicted AAA+ superfamily ATPase
MNIDRHIFEELLLWKNSTERKPLILRGARQVGKTTLVRQLAKTYKNCVLLNLELKEDLHFFLEYDRVQSLVEALFVAKNLSLTDKNDTLLFIDEIQESPQAIGLLRYFYEFESGLHVIAAGSLLEQSMRSIKSFPVGRVQFLYLYPVNFREFLGAIHKTSALEQLDNVPVREVAHHTLMDLFHRYAIVGGMPEVVRKYAKTESLTGLSTIYEGIWETYKEDVVKYAESTPEARIIKHIILTAPFSLDARVKFQNFGNSNYRSREIGEAFRQLNDAKVIQLIYPTTSLAPPMLPDLKKSPRLQFLDTGLINYELRIQVEMLAMDDMSKAYKGAVIPHVVAQEFMSLNTTKDTRPVFWVREKRQSSAEVDMVIPFEKWLIPVEIKSGKEGKLKSLHQFIEEAPHPYAVRMYAGKFSIDQHTTRSGKKYFLMNLPYYLGTKLPEYIMYFVANYG